MALCHIDAHKSSGYFPTFVLESRDNKRETIVSDYVDGQNFSRLTDDDTD